MKIRYFVLLHASLISVCALLLYGILTCGQDWGDDFAAYIMQAKSLIDGTIPEYIESNRFTIIESSRIIGPVTYPWGLPVLLVPAYACFGLNFLAMKMVIAVFYLLFLGLLSFGFRRMHTPLWLFCLVGLFACNPVLLDTINDTGSDIPFLLVSVFCVLLIGKCFVRGERVISPAYDAFILGAAMAVAGFFRTTGVLLPASLFCTQIITCLCCFRSWRKEQADSTSAGTGIHLLGRTGLRKLGVHCLPYVTYAVMMVGWRAVLPYDGSAYVSLLSQITPGSIKYHIEYYAYLPVYFYTGTPSRLLFYIASLPLLFVGVIRRWRCDYHIMVFACLTLMLHILWPETQGLRFIFPLLPFYVSFVLTGLRSVCSDRPSPRYTLRAALCALPVVFTIVCFLIYSAGIASYNLQHGRHARSEAFTPATNDMLAFILANTESESTVAFFKPRLMRLMTGRRSLLIDRVPDLPKADYFCLYTASQFRQIPFDALDAQVAQGTAHLIFENPDFRVYRMLTDEP